MFIRCSDDETREYEEKINSEESAAENRRSGHLTLDVVRQDKQGGDASKAVQCYVSMLHGQPMGRGRSSR